VEIINSMKGNEKDGKIRVYGKNLNYVPYCNSVYFNSVFLYLFLCNGIINVQTSKYP
jgi:hypothetical protein